MEGGNRTEKVFGRISSLQLQSVQKFAQEDGLAVQTWIGNAIAWAIAERESRTKITEDKLNKIAKELDTSIDLLKTIMFLFINAELPTFDIKEIKDKPVHHVNRVWRLMHAADALRDEARKSQAQHGGVKNES